MTKSFSSQRDRVSGETFMGKFFGVYCMGIKNSRVLDPEKLKKLEKLNYFVLGLHAPSSALICRATQRLLRGVAFL